MNLFRNSLRFHTGSLETSYGEEASLEHITQMKVEDLSMSTTTTSVVQPFIPSETILQRYANVFTHFALHGGEGMRPGETARITLPEFALPLYLPLQAAI